MGLRLNRPQVEIGYCQCGCGELAQIAPRSSTKDGMVRGQPMKFARGHYKGIAPEIRFWRLVQKTETCWLWLGGKHGQGYGMFYVKRDFTPFAHQYAYILSHGSIPEGLDILHTCDNPSCVRNDGKQSHLFAGTHADNMRDAANKGRAGWQKDPGALGRWSHEHPTDKNNVKLTASQVLELRALAYTMRHKDLAIMFNISESHVQHIIKRRKWKHI